MATNIATDRTTLALTPRGLAVAYTYRMRQAVEQLPPEDAATLLIELRELVTRYASDRLASNPFSEHPSA